MIDVDEDKEYFEVHDTHRGLFDGADAIGQVALE